MIEVIRWYSLRTQIPRSETATLRTNANPIHNS